jgi:hypothetical protein
MRITPLIDQFTAVLVGNFNPAIFSPSWFALNRLVSATDAETAEAVVVHSQLCQFKMRELTFLCDKDRITVSCAAAARDLARDLLLSTFGSILVHTPLAALGLNREVHFDAHSFAVRDAVGNLLAPKEPWGDWANELRNTSPITGGGSGLTSLSMNCPRPPDEYPGYIQALVQPSYQTALQQHGIYMNVNNHFDLKYDEKKQPVDQLIRIGDGDWNTAFEKSDFIIDQIQALTETVRSDLVKAKR